MIISGIYLTLQLKYLSIAYFLVTGLSTLCGLLQFLPALCKSDLLMQLSFLILDNFLKQGWNESYFFYTSPV